MWVWNYVPSTLGHQYYNNIWVLRSSVSCDHLGPASIPPTAPLSRVRPVNAETFDRAMFIPLIFKVNSPTILVLDKWCVKYWIKFYVCVWNYVPSIMGHQSYNNIWFLLSSVSCDHLEPAFTPPTAPPSHVGPVNADIFDHA